MGRFFDAGNYDEAYISRDFDTAFAKRFDGAADFDPENDDHIDYLLGFYYSYEVWEIPDEEHRALVETHDKDRDR